MAIIVVLTGPPLSGKSAVAEMLSQETGIPILEMDSIRLRILPQSLQSKEDRNTAYRSMHYTAERLVSCGVSPVALVATYKPWEHRRELSEVAAHCGASLSVIQFAIEPEAAVARFNERSDGHAAVDLTARRVRELAADYPYFDGAPIFETTDARVAATVDMVLKYLNSGRSLDNVIDWIDCAK